MCIDRSPGSTGRGVYGDTHPTHLVLDAFQGLPFEDDSLGYVYSSHTLEDAEDTRDVLLEWCRVIRTHGYLVLFLPDQKTYTDCCEREGLSPNQGHKHKDFGVDYVRERMPCTMDLVHTEFPVHYNRYSFELVSVKK
jgi:predicted SAM-dependent methyltransferase